MKKLQTITIAEWSVQYKKLADSINEPPFGGDPFRHVSEGDTRLRSLQMDPSPEALTLWNFLLTEESRLKEAKAAGTILIGTMKDLGTIPIMAYSCENSIAFYPDGAWWIPCIMELSAGLFKIADAMGIDEAFCPVRAMLGAFANENHFPHPNLLICSTGAICDDFSAIAQRLQGMGHYIHWWEVPRRSHTLAPQKLPGNNIAEANQLSIIKEELLSVKEAIEGVTDQILSDRKLSEGIKKANHLRRCLCELRDLVFLADRAPLPALELLICEMLAIHYCSDYRWAKMIIEALLTLCKKRVADKKGYFNSNAVKVFWVNPVADLKAMNILEESGGRICGTEFLFTHALDPIPTHIPPIDALAQIALADPMVGPTEERAKRIIADIKRYGSQALIISKIPGASHCAIEGKIIAEMVSEELGIPTLEIEIPPLCDSMEPSIRTRIEALIESVNSSSIF